MAHTLDTALQSNSQTGNPTNITYTCGAGTTLLLVHIVTAGSVDRAGGAPTYNGVTLTQVDTVRKFATSPETGCELWYLVNPSTGSAYTLTIPNTGARTLHVTTSSAKAASGKTSALDVSTGNTGNTANPSLSVSTTVAGDFITAICGHGAAAPGTGNKTQYLAAWGVDHGAYNSMRMYELQAASGSTTFTFTVAADDWGMILAAFKEVNAPSGPTNTGWLGGGFW